MPRYLKDDNYQAKGCDDLAQPLSRPASNALRKSNDRKAEHQMCEDGPGNSTRYLSPNVMHERADAEMAQPPFDERYNRIEMSARDVREGGNQRD
jgi:hypothetical protein